MNKPSIVFLPLDAVPDSQPAFAVIAARHEGKWLFVRHKQRTTWEIPGGHREPGETALEAAQRELREETGATDFTVTPVCIYGVERDGRTTYGLLCLADVTVLGPLDPAMEIGEVMLQSTLPEALTYPAIQPALHWQIQGWLNMQSAPDEIWDVYDKNRRLTGCTHRRGDLLAPGDYHLVVHVYLMNSSGDFLCTRRAPSKGFPNMWECTGGSASAGEDSLTAALREVREETGLTVRAENAALILQYRRSDAFIDVYVIRQDFALSDVVLLPGETTDAQYIPKAELLRRWENGEFVPHSYIPELMRLI